MSLIKTQFSLNKLFGNNDRVRWGILAGVTIIFTILLYPSLVVKKHSYKLGDVATKDIKAKKDFLIEDEDATETSRIQALENVQTVYDHDVTLSGKMNRQIEAAFVDLQTIFEASKTQDPLKTSETSSLENVGGITSFHDIVWQKKPEFEDKLGISISDGAYKILEKEAFSKDISNLISKISTEILGNGVVANKELLLKEADKGIILRDIKTKKEKVVFNLKHFYDLDQAKTMVKIIGQPLIKNRNYTLRNMIVDFSQRLIQPNITLNRSETEERKKEVYAGIKPIFHKIKAGEMLLREGELVTRVQLLKLNAYREGVKNEQVLVSCVGSTLIILCILMTTYILCIHNQPHLDNTKNLLF